MTVMIVRMAAPKAAVPTLNNAVKALEPLNPSGTDRFASSRQPTEALAGHHEHFAGARPAKRFADTPLGKQGMGHLEWTHSLLRKGLRPVPRRRQSQPARRQFRR